MNGGLLLMAQILKDDLREKLKAVALLEFMANGYLNSSLRSIAKNSNITAGNIYHYYKNKEDLFFAVIQPVFDRINSFLKQHSNNTLDLERIPDNDLILYVKNREHNMDTINDFADMFVEIHKDNKEELLLLITKSEGFKYGHTNHVLIDWVQEILVKKTQQESDEFLNDLDKRIYAKVMAASFVKGIIVLVEECKTENQLKYILQKHIQSYFL